MNLVNNRISHNFIYAVHLAGCGAMNLVPEKPPCDVNWNSVLRYAREQSVESLVFCGLRNGESHDCPADVFSKLKKRSLSIVLQNQLRTEAVVKLLLKAEAAGIQPIVIKGIVISECYTVPEARSFCDTDIYIDPQYEERLLSFLDGNGFDIAPRDGFYHTTCFNRKIGLFEVHNNLFSENARNIWLHDIALADYIKLRPFRVSLKAGDIHTLDPTSHFIFISLHMLNHFINTGTSLKMCLDILLYYEKYKSEINRVKAEEAITACHGALLFKAITDILEHAGLPVQNELFSRLESNPEISGLLCRDLQNGGEMGKNQLLERQISRNAYVSERMISVRGRFRYALHKTTQYLYKLRQYFFPTRSELRINYPESGPWKAYSKHVRTRLRSFSSRKKQAKRISESVHTPNRTILLKGMGILNDDK